MEDVRLLHSLDKPSNLRTIVKNDLRESGVKVPKPKKSKKLNLSRSASQDGSVVPNIFGNYLSLVPSKYVTDCGFVPKFLVEAAEIIEQHCQMEGIFRKSGSINRQKELKQQVEDGQKLLSENVHDVTGLVKQFFRELPEPLLTSVYHNSFVRCYNMAPPKQVESMLLLCLLLPMEHLSTLRFAMGLLSRLAAHSTHNKMDEGNLAVVLAPNIMHVNSRTQKMNSTEEKLLQIQTAIVEILIRNADSIGVVSDSLSQRTALMTEYFGTEDELDASDDNTLEDSKDVKEPKRKIRKRSSSLQGIVSSIGRGIAKLRRSTDGKSNLTVSSGSSLDNESQLTSQCRSLSATQPAGELSLPSHEHSLATPVVRKRKMSGEVMPFSATKRKAILEQLPHKSALGATPFTPASTKKCLRHDVGTPNLTYTDQSQMASISTPKHSTNKTIRKKMNLFSPGSSRKPQRSKSSVDGAALCSSALRKSARTKHLFKRLSGGKEKNNADDEEEHALSPAQIPQSQSAMELSDSERSPVGVRGALPCLSQTDPFVSSPTRDDGNTLNQGFIDPDMTAELDAMTTVDCPKDSGQTLRRANSFKSAQKPVPRPVSTDGALRRGQPNKLNNGLLEGKIENVKKLRRSFDKSDISRPIPIHPERPQSATEASRPSETESVLTQKQVRASISITERSGRADEQSFDMESSLLNVVLPPPSGFKDQSMMEMDMDREGNEDGSDEESEAGFSTISGGTVIHNPPAHLLSLAKGKSEAAHIVHYGSSVSVTAQHPPLSLQPSVSVDSLISTGSESSGVSATGQIKILDRSASIDSGKGSLLDGDDAGSCGRRLNKTYIKTHELDHTMMEMEDSAMSAENISQQNTSRSIKSLSAEDLKARKRMAKPTARSQSMYVGGSGHHSNMIPNLQISAETCRLLTRAGFMDTSLPPNMKDFTLPVKAAQKRESSTQSFSRDSRHTCSFRLERSGTFKKDKSSILFTEHHTPVKEETNMELDEAYTDNSQFTGREEKEPMEEDVWQKREFRISGEDVSMVPAIEKPESKEDTQKQQTYPKSKAKEQADRSRPSVSLKRAEMRMQKHESVLQIKESNAGRVAQNVQQFNSSLDQSLNQSNNASLNFQHCTSRKRGVSPVRIPTIFAKNKTEPSAAYYQELAQKSLRKPKISESLVKSINEEKCEQNNMAEGSRSRGQENKTASEDNFKPSKRREMMPSLMDSTDIDLSSSLQETIEDILTPRRQKCRGQNLDSTRSPLRESTNLKLPEETHQLRTTKGLTPHQISKYGPKTASSERSPGKPIKRLQSPHNKHSPHPRKTLESKTLHVLSPTLSMSTSDREHGVNKF